MESKKEVMHTPEPWLIDCCGNIVCDEGDQLPFGGVSIPMTCGPRMDTAKSNVRRVVACVNACAGISTELLEQQGIKAVLAPSESSKTMAEASTFLIQSNARQLHLTAQRDELLAALKEADLFIRNGIELGFIRMPDKDTPDRAHKVPGIVSSAITKCEVKS